MVKVAIMVESSRLISISQACSVAEVEFEASCDETVRPNRILPKYACST